MSGDAYQCKLLLPPSAAFQILVGPLSSNSHLSKQLVCFDACKKLHQMGALSDHLLPISDEPSESEATLKSRESASGAGMPFEPWIIWKSIFCLLWSHDRTPHAVNLMIFAARGP